MLLSFNIDTDTNLEKRPKINFAQSFELVQMIILPALLHLHYTKIILKNGSAS